MTLSALSRCKNWLMIERKREREWEGGKDRAICKFAFTLIKQCNKINSRQPMHPEKVLLHNLYANGNNSFVITRVKLKPFFSYFSLMLMHMLFIPQNHVEHFTKSHPDLSISSQDDELCWVVNFSRLYFKSITTLVHSR